MLIQIHGKKKLIEKYWGGCGEDGCGHSVLRTVKVALDQAKLNEIN